MPRNCDLIAAVRVKAVAKGKVSAWCGNPAVDGWVPAAPPPVPGLLPAFVLHVPNVLLPMPQIVKPTKLLFLSFYIIRINKN